MAINLTKILRAGPDVSFNGSPTVSPITAALCSSDPFLQTSPLALTNYPDSIYFLALSQAPPVKKGLVVMAKEEAKNEPFKKQHYENVYKNEADRYDLLINREDYKKNLFLQLQDIFKEHFGDLATLRTKAVVEMGAGTGRLTRFLAPLCERIIACDRSAAMLNVCKKQMKQQSSIWDLCISEHERMSIQSGVADVVIEGWAFGHLVNKKVDSEMFTTVSKALKEMERVCKKGGIMIIIETLGTNRITPLPPQPYLDAFYKYIVKECGYEYHCSVRTDYKFTTQAEANHLIQFFFGREMVEELHVHQDHIASERKEEKKKKKEKEKKDRTNDDAKEANNKNQTSVTSGCTVMHGKEKEEEEESGYIVPECTGFWIKRLS